MPLQAQGPAIASPTVACARAVLAHTGKVHTCVCRWAVFNGAVDLDCADYIHASWYPKLERALWARGLSQSQAVYVARRVVLAWKTKHARLGRLFEVWRYIHKLQEYMVLYICSLDNLTLTDILRGPAVGPMNEAPMLESWPSWGSEDDAEICKWEADSEYDANT